MKRKMKSILSLGLASLVAAGSLAAAPQALAKEGDIVRNGSCSGATDWKLKLSREDGKIEVEFEVDQNKNGDDWRVTLKKDGERFFRGLRTTKAPSGSFEVNKRTGNGPGDEHIVGKATNLSTEETCRGAATATF